MQPGLTLGVDKSLLDLVPLPLGRLGSGVVLPQPLDGDQPVVTVLQELGGRRRVGHEPPDHRGQAEGDETQTEEDALIRLQPGLGMADTVRQEGSQDGCHRVGDLPCDSPVRLF